MTGEIAPLPLPAFRGGRRGPHGVSTYRRGPAERAAAGGRAAAEVWLGSCHAFAGEGGRRRDGGQNKTTANRTDDARDGRWFAHGAVVASIPSVEAFGVKTTRPGRIRPLRARWHLGTRPAAPGVSGRWRDWRQGGARVGLKSGPKRYGGDSGASRCSPGSKSPEEVMQVPKKGGGVWARLFG